MEAPPPTLSTPTPGAVESTPAPQPDPAPAPALGGGLGGSSSRPSRERKQVCRLTIGEPKKKTKLEIKSGKGVKLGEIPNVAFRIGKFTRKDDFLKKIHNLLYRKPGAYLVIKKNILEFSGFFYEESLAQAELEKDTNKLAGFTVEELNLLLDTFDLPRGKGDDAKKGGKVNRILDFLSSPKVMSDKDLATMESKKKMKRKRAAGRKKKKKSASAAAKKGKAEGPKKKAKKKAKPTTLADDSSDDEYSSSSDGGEDEASESESSDDSAPLLPLKKTPEHVTPDALKKEIRHILKSVDLSTFSLKDMMQKLSAEFGGADLKPHKPFIKEQVSIGLSQLS
mmetsp:Transcript_3208/g.9502  ORF Transcript_3208/g.9502 Transcript_3208/m.9502 type:complete len:338 (+) Transcript_3208:194-1207(+)